MSINIGIASFIISMILHFSNNYLVHKYGKLMRSKKEIILRPVLIVADDDYSNFQHTPRL